MVQGREANVLGRSGTAETLLVRDGALTFVEKRLLTRAQSSEEATAAFEREGIILEALGGRGAPRFLERGHDEHGAYLRMETLVGSPLEALPAQSAVRFGLVAKSAFLALARVHEADDEHGPLEVLHNDLSPSNVLVSVDDVDVGAWLVDFGLASYRDGGPPRDGAFRGTLATAAPEIAREEAASVRSDLFAMAASLVTVLLGTPLRRDVASDALALVLAGDVPIHLPPLPVAPATEAALRGCLNHEASDRPESARHVLDLLGVP